jgi:flagellar motility protein MotE (MotC chaperone)
MSEIEDQLNAIEDQIEAMQERVNELSDLIDDDKLHGYAILRLCQNRVKLVERIKGMKAKAKQLAVEWVDDQIADERMRNEWL